LVLRRQHPIAATSSTSAKGAKNVEPESPEIYRGDEMKKVLSGHVLLISLALSTGVTTFAQGALGGYRTASTTDERVVAAAEYAVAKKSEEQEGLTLDVIEKAETQTVAGINYRLCLKVSLDDEKQEVKAVVYQNLQRDYSLTSWVVEDCSESASSHGYKMIKRALGTSIVAGAEAAHCRGEQLSLREAEGEADMSGKRYENDIFTNASSISCALAGHTKFVLLNKIGKALREVSVKYSYAFVQPGTDENKSLRKSQPATVEPGKTA
jgi:hypothetical protein